jgi:hypothetical protein
MSGVSAIQQSHVTLNGGKQAVQSRPLIIAASHGQSAVSFVGKFGILAAPAAPLFAFAAPAWLDRIAQIARVGGIHSEDTSFDILQGAEIDFVREHIAKLDQPVYFVHELGRLHFTDTLDQLLAMHRRAGQSHRFEKRDFTSAQIDVATHTKLSATNRPLSRSLFSET